MTPSVVMAGYLRRSRSFLRGFYLLSPLLAVELLWNLRFLLAQPPSAYQWPVSWIIPSLHGPSVVVILIAFFLSSVVAARHLLSRRSRICVLVSGVMVSSLLSSYGKVLHSQHLWVWMALFFVFLPQSLGSQRGRQLWVGVFWWASFYIYASYSLAGLYKVGASILYFPGWFSPDALTNLLLLHELKTGHTGFLVPLLLDQPWVVVFFSYGVLALTLSALPVFLMGRGIRVWSLLLVGYHLATFELMGIGFFSNVAIVIGLGIFSPVTDLRSNWVLYGRKCLCRFPSSIGRKLFLVPTRQAL